MSKMSMLLATTALLAACDRDKSNDNEVRAADAAAPAAEAEAKAEKGAPSTQQRKLGAGRFLVTVEMPGACLDRGMNLAQTYTFPNADVTRPMTIELKADGRIFDNVIRPAVCRSPSTDTGIALVTLSQTGFVSVPEEAKIIKVEQIVELDFNSQDVAAALPSGEYLVKLSRAGACMPTSFTAKRELDYDWEAGVITTRFQNGSAIATNLMSPQHCPEPNGKVRDTASEYVIIGAADGLGGKLAVAEDLQIESVQMIRGKK